MYGCMYKSYIILVEMDEKLNSVLFPNLFRFKKKYFRYDLSIELDLHTYLHTHMRIRSESFGRDKFLILARKYNSTPPFGFFNYYLSPGGLHILYTE